MSPALGQALRWVQRLLRVAIALLMVAGIGLGALAWRLAQGPLELEALAGQIEQAASAGMGGNRLEVGRAAIAWGGWRDGSAAPLDIRLSDVRLIGADGGLRADLPEAAVTLSMRALLLGRLAPATIALHRPSLLIYREEDGGVGLQAARAPADGTPPPAPSGTAEPLPLQDLLADLMRPVADSSSHAALRRIRITNAEVMVVDRLLDRRWTLGDTALDIRRAAEGGLAAEGSATIRSAGLTVPVRLHGAASGRPARISAGLSLPALRPAELAAIFPGLAPTRVLDAPVTLAATAEFAAENGLTRMHARLRAGAGALDLGQGRRLPFASLVVGLAGDSRAFDITDASLQLPGPAGGRLSARGMARLADGRWQGSLALALAPLSMAQLHQAWPAGLAPAARQAVLAALPAALLREAKLDVTFNAPEALDTAALEEARATLALEAALLDLGPQGRVAAQEVTLSARLTPQSVQLEHLALRLPAPDAQGGAALPGPLLTATGEAQREGSGWRGTLELGLDAMRFADLPTYWPESLQPKEREWITQNLTAGRISNGQWRFEAVMPEGPESLRVTALSGTAEARDVTVHWLRPIPPVEGADGVATFSLSEVSIQARNGRQMLPGGRSGTLEVREATIRFFNFDQRPGNAEIGIRAAGPLPELFTLLRHPRLKLFERRRLELDAAGGAVETQLQIAFPLWKKVPMEALRIDATGRITDARLRDAPFGQDLEQGNFEVAVDTEGLTLSGQATLAEVPLQLAVEMDFRNGPPTQTTERATITSRPEARHLAALGLDTGGILEGPVALEAKLEKRRSGRGQIALRGDLRDARLALDAVGWAKPAGRPGMAEAVLRLQGDALAAIEGIRVDAPELALRGRAGFGGSRLAQVEIVEGRVGASRFSGEMRRSVREGEPWSVALRGPVLDLRPILNQAGSARPPAPTSPTKDRGSQTALPLALDLRFDQVAAGGSRNLQSVTAAARTDAQGLLREAQVTGRIAETAGGFAFILAPHGQERHLQLTAEDGGALLQALDLADAIRGGRLSVTAVYPELRAGAPLSGTAELDQFSVRNAPALGKLLQAMTLYGLPEAMQGEGGLMFTKLIAPFTLTREALTLADARAFSASLGLTAKGRIWRERRQVDIEGTVVPAYFFNQLLGNIPILGRLFSPEAGGGVFAATYRVQGPLADPTVTVNPLAALTPGFLRGLFGIGEQSGAAR